MILRELFCKRVEYQTYFPEVEEARKTLYNELHKLPQEQMLSIEEKIGTYSCESEWQGFYHGFHRGCYHGFQKALELICEYSEDASWMDHIGNNGKADSIILTHIHAWDIIYLKGAADRRLAQRVSVKK